jgi:uncharacterized MAPEG superfamily protein
MSELLSTYQLTSYSWGALTLLLIVQILIADLIGIKSRHTPGSPVEADHQNLLFRATRTVVNTNESIGVYVLVVLFCLFQGADPGYTGILSWAYVAARAAYAVCYYSNQQTMRSICFGFSLLVLIAMLINGFAF